jgi:hypothetical protein
LGPSIINHLVDVKNGIKAIINYQIILKGVLLVNAI